MSVLRRLISVGRAGALADHHVEPGPQVGQGGQRHLEQLGLPLAVAERVDLAHRLAHHDDVAAPGRCPA